jgi:SAM-dependent methyltransferase
MPDFKDHFSAHASAYAAFRPQSPPQLFAYLASLVSDVGCAWDVGTGNGQAALGLAPYFDRVIATDASADQIHHAPSHVKVEYVISPAEKSDIPSGIVSLTTAAQAIHWFSFDDFYREVRRVSKPNAVIAAWTYHLASINPAVDAIVAEYYDMTLKDYWPAERRYVDEKYSTIPFPFDEISAPMFLMEETRNLSDWLGYLSTWSATQRAIKALGPQVFEGVAEKLLVAWGHPESRKTVTWPLHLRVGRIK